MGSSLKRVFRRFDYSSIYLLIGGTFTPIFLLFLDKPIGLYLCIGMWAFIATGISLVGVFGPVRLKRSEGFGTIREKLEYEDLAKIARETGRSIEDIRAAVTEECRKKGDL